jgi:hypothetical protein
VKHLPDHEIAERTIGQFSQRLARVGNRRMNIVKWFKIKINNTMAAKDYQICPALFNAYIAKSAKGIQIK